MIALRILTPWACLSPSHQISWVGANVPSFLPESREKRLWVGIPSFHTNASLLGLYNLYRTPYIFQSAECKNKMKNYSKWSGWDHHKILQLRNRFYQDGHQTVKTNITLFVLYCLHQLVMNLLWSIFAQKSRSNCPNRFSSF